MSLDYTYPGLEATREAMYHFKMKPANDEVGHSALRVMAGWGAEGIRDLWEVAMLTYWPVVQHLFGKETFSPERTPDAIETLYILHPDGIVCAIREVVVIFASYVTCVVLPPVLVLEALYTPASIGINMGLDAVFILNVVINFLTLPPALESDFQSVR